MDSAVLSEQLSTPINSMSVTILDSDSKNHLKPIRPLNTFVRNVFLVWLVQLTSILGIISLMMLLHKMLLFKVNTGYFYAFWVASTVIHATICFWRQSRQNRTVKLIAVTVFHGISWGCAVITPVLTQKQLLMWEIIEVTTYVCLATALFYDLSWSYSYAFRGAAIFAFLINLCWLWFRCLRFIASNIDFVLTAAVPTLCAYLIFGVHIMVHDAAESVLTLNESVFTALTVYIDVVRVYLVYLGIFVWTFIILPAAIDGEFFKVY